MARFAEMRAQVRADARESDLSDPEKLVRALIMPAMFVAMADGYLDEVEISTITEFFEADREWSFVLPVVPKLMSDLQAWIRFSAPEDLIAEAVAILNEEQRVKAIELAKHVALADGDFDIEEQGTLVALAKNFGVSIAV